jgi:hypothetical protein
MITSRRVPTGASLITLSNIPSMPAHRHCFAWRAL